MRRALCQHKVNGIGLTQLGHAKCQIDFMHVSQIEFVYVFIKEEIWKSHSSGCGQHHWSHY